MFGLFLKILTELFFFHCILRFVNLIKVFFFNKKNLPLNGKQNINYKL